MKHGKIILSASAIIVAVVSAFAFTSKIGNGTLYTDSAGHLKKVACSQINTHAGSCPTATYYTVNGAKVGRITPYIIAE